MSRDENGNKAIDDVKNGVHHTVPMSNNLYQILKEYQQHCQDIGDDCQWLFHQKNGNVHWAQQTDLWIKWIYKFDKVVVMNGINQTLILLIRKSHCVILRHTLATLLYDGKNNIKPKDIQFVLGHKTPKTAMAIYTHVTKKQKKDIKSSINNLNF